MKGRNPTAAEKRYMTAAVELGCWVCMKHYDTYSPATIHHIDGKTKPGAHYNAIPLCAHHHQIASSTGEWATRHGPGRNTGKKAFESAYGTEISMRDEVWDVLGVNHEEG